MDLDDLMDGARPERPPSPRGRSVAAILALVLVLTAVLGTLVALAAWLGALGAVLLWLDL